MPGAFDRRPGARRRPDGAIAFARCITDKDDIAEFYWISSRFLPAVQPFVEAGKLRALAVTTTKRWPELPDVPTVSEAGVPGIFRNVIPMMRRRGYSEAEIKMIMVETPKRLLTFV